jgi:hypothetical protein
MRKPPSAAEFSKKKEDGATLCRLRSFTSASDSLKSIDRGTIVKELVVIKKQEPISTATKDVDNQAHEKIPMKKISRSLKASVPVLRGVLGKWVARFNKCED